LFGTAVGEELHRVIGTDFDHYHWYVEKSRALNARAIGGHTIAVTSTRIDLHREHKLADDRMIAVVLHEYGHHRGELERFGAGCPDM